MIRFTTRLFSGTVTEGHYTRNLEGLPIMRGTPDAAHVIRVAFTDGSPELERPIEERPALMADLGGLGYELFQTGQATTGELWLGKRPRRVS